MALSDLTEKIKNDGKEKRECILEDAQKEIAAIEKKKNEDSARITNSMNAQLKEDLAEEERRVAALGGHSAKIALLEARRDVLDEVFDEALNALLELESSAFKKLYTALLKSIPKEGAITLYCQEKRKGDVESIAKDLSLSANIVVDENVKGVLVEEGGGAYDLTFKKLLEKKRPELEVALMENVFSGKTA